ncbi:carbohydrate-binding module family 13 protein [Calocera cornea HHB12733]|uniref:Carbohydrate-binding module family 13 protein n=1 Tax=Calocera cornea HHB12733 TaxID=1353952 RepID=A0A165I7Q5_9BASI|nr:carbohydrate-binding module family 13 protein [Calocera cornea HHB12733]
MAPKSLPPIGKFPAQGKAVVIADGTYNIINLASGTALRISGTENIVGDSRELPLSTQPEEEWTLKYDHTQNAYTIVNKSSGTYITSDQLYTPLVQGQTEIFQATSSQLSYFTLHLTTITGAYAINPAEGGQVVELFQGSSASGTAVQIVDSDGTPKQLWSFAAIA